VLFYVLFVLCRSRYCLSVYMCIVLLPPGGYPVAIKYIISKNIYIFYCKSKIYCFYKVVDVSTNLGHHKVYKIL